MAWFQYPRNHHMASWLQDKVFNAKKPIYLYISHEHKDHYDPEFLRRLKKENIEVLIPKFRRKSLRDDLGNLGFEKITEVTDGGTYSLQNGSIRIYVEDAELDRDSAILVSSGKETFLNLNDCKIYDKLPEILREYGSIDVFTAQFSGATWHPTCYQYTVERYREISRNKKHSKFKTLMRAIQILNPKIYIPSAGPACFLDPDLFHLNFEEENIFPRSEVFKDYLTSELRENCPRWIGLQPGDVLNISSGAILEDRSVDRAQESSVREYLAKYSNDYVNDFAAMKVENEKVDLLRTLIDLQKELQAKLDLFPMRADLNLPFYFGLIDFSEKIVRVDFQKGSVDLVETYLLNPPYYRVLAQPRQIRRLLDRKMNWEDFSLTFRVQIDRQPDEYKTLLNAFVFVDSQDLPAFCAKWESMQKNMARLKVDVGGKTYEIAHYCPHQNADLSAGWSEDDRYWVCPKHGWKFDLTNGGKCTLNASTLNAKCIK